MNNLYKAHIGSSDSIFVLSGRDLTDVVYESRRLGRLNFSSYVDQVLAPAFADPEVSRGLFQVNPIFLGSRSSSDSIERLPPYFLAPDWWASCLTDFSLSLKNSCVEPLTLDDADRTSIGLGVQVSISNAVLARFVEQYLPDRAAHRLESTGYYLMPSLLNTEFVSMPISKEVLDPPSNLSAPGVSSAIDSDSHLTSLVRVVLSCREELGCRLTGLRLTYDPVFDIVVVNLLYCPTVINYFSDYGVIMSELGGAEYVRDSIEAGQAVALKCYRLVSGSDVRSRFTFSRKRSVRPASHHSDTTASYSSSMTNATSSSTTPRGFVAGKRDHRNIDASLKLLDVM